MTIPTSTAFVLVALSCVAVPRSDATEPDSAATAKEAVVATGSAATADSAMRPNWCYYLRGQALVRIDATPLELRQSVGAGDVAKNLLYGGGGKHWMTIPGPTSETRVTQAQPHFRVRCERVVVLTVRLGAFEVRQEKRWAQLDAGRPREFFKHGLALKVEQISEGLYDLSPAKPLLPGEYGLAASYAGPVSDFTVTGGEQEK